jgi:hypothetical protein
VAIQEFWYSLRPMLSSIKFPQRRLVLTNPAPANHVWCEQAMHSSTDSDITSRSFEAELFEIEFSDLHVLKEDSVKPRCDQLDSYSSLRNTSLMKTLFLCQLMPPLFLTLRRRRPLGTLTLPTCAAERLSVRDTGGGVTTQDMERFFDTFYATKK